MRFFCKFNNENNDNKLTMVSRYVPNFTLGVSPGVNTPNGHPQSHIAPMPLGVAMAATAAAAAAAAAVPLSTITQTQTQPQQSQSGSSAVGQPSQQPPLSQVHTSQTMKGPPQFPLSNSQTSAEYHVQQCLMSTGSAANASQQVPPQHQHYRFIHSRSDGYVAAPSTGFPAPQSGPSHQGPPVIRGMQSAPPSTPPQQDLSKMQQPPQTMYVPAGGGTTTSSVRPNQQANLFRNASTAAPRGSRQIAMPQMFPPQMQQMVMPFYAQHSAPRQPASQMYTTQQYFSQAPQIPTSFHYPYFVPNSFVSQHRPNAVPGGIVSAPAGAALAAGPGAPQAQILSTNVLAGTGAATGQPGTVQTSMKKRRKHAIDIIDPNTNKNVLDDMEMSKNQNTTVLEVDYQEQMNLPPPSNDILCGGVASTNQIMDANINTDPNYSSKTSQGMPFVDMMQHHKISAIPPSCQTQIVSQVNEIIGTTTPIVSAMSDGPSVEIHPKQQIKKKNRSVEPIPPLPTQTTTTDKVFSENSKTQGNVHGHSSINEGCPDKNSQQITTAVNVPLVNQTEDNNLPHNKAINRNGENKTILTVHSANTNVTESSVNIDSKDPSSIVNDGSNNKTVTPIVGPNNNINSNNSNSSIVHQQQQQQNSSIQYSLLPSVQQHHSTSASFSNNQQQQSKRDIKSSSIYHQQQKSIQQQHSQSTLPSPAINNFVVVNSDSSASNTNNNQSSSSNNKYFPPQTTTASSASTTVTNVQQQQQQSAASVATAVSNKGVSSNNNNSSSVVSNTPSKNNKGKDKTHHHQHHYHHHQQQQQPTSNNNNNNPEKTDTTDTVAVGINSTISQNKQSNNSNIAANNSSQQSYTAIDNKMKLNEKDENKQKLISSAPTVATNDQQQQQQQDKDLSTTTNTAVSHSNYGKKMPLHDKNENKICDQFDNNNDIQKTATTTISTTTITNLSIESNNNNFDNRSSLDNATTAPISHSLDETDRVCNVDVSDKLVDNVVYNKNDKSFNAVNENISTNSSSTVFVKSKSSSPSNDNDNRIQQKQLSSVSTGNNNANISSSSSLKNTTQPSEIETTLLASTSSDKREINDHETTRRQSNSSAIDGCSLATDIPAITNGSVTPSSGPLSPPSTNNLTNASANTDHQEKPVQPVSTITQSSIRYNDGQWSPANQSGTKVYDRSQLLNLRNSPHSKEKPPLDLTRNEVAAILLQQTRIPNLLPTFATRSANKRITSTNGPNMSLGGGGSMSGSTAGNTYLKQASMSGVNAKNNSKGSKSGMIHLSLSLREDVKLNEIENAWRPTHLKQNENLPPEERAKDDLLRKVRGILNKLTPEKFDTLVDQIMELQIDSKDKVNGVMMLVFEKAIDEPNFSTSYAKLCQRLADHKLPDDKSDTTENEKSAAQQRANNLTAFKITLLDKTEHEFKDNVSDCQAKQRKLQPLIEKIAECTDEEKKLELQAILEEEERKIRRRSGGTVRFIGELFKISMLTHNIIRNCIDNLLDPTSEDKLECLCKLLSTVGEKFESTPAKSPRCNNLDEVINKMKNIVNRKIESKISSRVRFMLQDVIDLRKKRWVSTKTDANPKTMDQIQKEVKTEQMTNQYANFNLMSSNKDRRFVSGGGGGGIGGTSGSGGSGLAFGSGSNITSSSGSGGYYKSNRQAQSGDDTWYTQTPKGNRAVDTNKLTFSIDIDNGTKLGGMSKYQWTSGSSGVAPTTTTSNSFAVLSSLDSSKSSSSSGPRNKGSYNKESMERDRYGSAHGSRDNSSSRSASARGSIGDREKDRDRENNSSNRGSLQRGPPSHHSYSSSPSSTVPSRSNKAPSLLSSQTYDTPRQPPPAVFEKPNDEVSNSIKSAIFEMINISEESFCAAEQIMLKFPEKYYWNFIFAIFNDYLHSTKVKPNHRKIASDLVYHILNQNIITIEHFRYAYQEFSELADDIVIDVPGLWQYIFQFIGPLVYKKVLTIEDIWNNTLREKDMGSKFLKEMILFFVKEVGSKYMRELWKSSNLKWSDFLLSDDIEKYIQENSFKFIESEEFKAPIIGATDMQKIRDRLKELLNETPDIDAINDYLDSNIVNIDKPFIRVLTETLCGYAIINNNVNKSLTLDSTKFRKVCIPLLNRYLDSNEERELECLYAIQLLIHELEHPSGLLNEIFGELYDADIIPSDSFQKWRDSKDEPTGKGVAVKGLHSFFSNILSGETSDENN